MRVTRNERTPADRGPPGGCFLSQLTDSGDGVPHTFGVPRLRGSAVGRGTIEWLEISRLPPSRPASPNRLKMGLQTNEGTLAVASDSSSTLQLFNPSTSIPMSPRFKGPGSAECLHPGEACVPPPISQNSRPAWCGSRSGRRRRRTFSRTRAGCASRTRLFRGR